MGIVTFGVAGDLNRSPSTCWNQRRSNIGEAHVAARGAIARVAVDTFAFRVVEVAKVLNKHPNSISRWRTHEPTERCRDICQRVQHALINSPGTDSTGQSFDC